MFLALEEAPFVLQGPKPTIPPAAWESYWGSGLIALGLIALAVVALRQFLRKGPPSLAPLAQLDVALRLADGPDEVHRDQLARMEIKKRKGLNHPGWERMVTSRGRNPLISE